MSLTTYSITDLLDLRPPAWLVEGVIPVQGLTAIYGQPGDGKSFIALDMALAVASARPWQGHPTKKGYVVYISAEGGGGISKRVGAWLAHNKVKSHEYADIFISFVVSAIRVHPESQDLTDILEQTINHADYRRKLVEDSVEVGRDPNQEEDPPLFIIVDTLARCFDGDENQQEDMGNFIKGLDNLRDNHEATVLVVHHTNKSSLDERGSSSFRGACDTMVLTEKKENDITLTCTKQKDYEQFPVMACELVLVPAWDSCIVEATTLRIAHEGDLVAAYLAENPAASVRDIAAALNLSKSTVHRRKQELSRG